MNKGNWKLWLATVGVFIGLALMGSVLILGDQLSGPVNGLMCGLGGALVGGGASSLLLPLLLRSMSPEQRREVERGEHDERNVSIREKAAQSSFYWTLCLLWVPFVVALMQGSILWIVLTSGLVVLHNVFYLVNLALWDRRL